MINEFVRHRALAAMRFIDASTDLLITTPVIVSGEDVKVVGNRRNDYILLARRNRQDPVAPIELSVQAPGGQYLPRGFTLPLPRDPDPQNASSDNSLFQTIDVNLFRTPSAAIPVGYRVFFQPFNRHLIDMNPKGVLTKRKQHVNMLQILSGGKSRRVLEVLFVTVECTEGTVPADIDDTHLPRF